MDIGQLRGLLLDLECMTALRHTLKNRAVAALVALCRECARDDASEAALTAAYCRAYDAWLDAAAHGRGGFAREALEAVLFEESPAALLCARMDVLPYSLTNAMANDLDALGRLTAIEPAMFLLLCERAGMSGQTAARLPVWEPTLGSAFSLSTAVQAGIQLFAAAFMLAMALNLLGCFRFLPSLRLPGRLSDLFRSRSSFVIGLANGLMPCGPLQAMQLFALSTGSWYMGALSMFCFSLGTVPLMLGVGLISGTLNRRFAGPMRIACAALVAVMGMNMLQNALSLAGFAAPAAVQPESTEDGVAYFSDGVQLVHTTLDYRSYAPITVKAGIPVRWTITADSRVLNGCNEALVIPEYSIQKGLAPGDNIIEFTPAEIGTFPYSCWMGMIRSSITVEP